MLLFIGFLVLAFVGSGVSGHWDRPRRYSEPSCPKNEHYTRNNPRCLRTCANKWVPTSDDCKPFTGCVCNCGLVRLNDDASGKCVPKSKCPHRENPKKTRDRVCSAYAEAKKKSLKRKAKKKLKAVKKLKAFAKVTQEKTKSDGKSFSHSRSKCSSRSKSSSSFVSVVSGGCRANKCKDCNAVYKDVLNPCPLTCASPKPRPCPYAAIKKGGCECVPGFVLNEANGKCVRPKDCTGKKCRDPNAVYIDCPNPCPLSCDRPFPRVCNKACVRRGCQCASGYILDIDDIKHGKCVRPKNCPAKICCPKHSHYVIEDNQCQKTCANRLMTNSDVAGACVPFTGCACRPGYVKLYKNATGPCIPENKCPIECGENEVASDCVIQCPTQSCESLFTTYLCAETKCTAGCNCIDGYLRNSLGICVPSEECYNDPAGCGGDVNARRARGCVSPYPPTCKNPDPKLSSDVCELNGCECKPGFIKSCKDGNCIESKDCPGGSPNCGANQTYVGCKFGCPTNYCPADDSRGLVACSLPYPCQGGCACTAGYLIVSRDNPQCVLASDCPDVKCTRPNEVLDRNPSRCFFERCEDRGSECNSPYPPGPRCVCEDGYYRNESDICIPVSECPPLGCEDDLNATYTECTSNCPPTCEDIGQEPKGCTTVCGPAGCACNPGYVLNQVGKCIDPKDCPGCKDPNAVYRGCPSVCEPTCKKPDRNQACTRQCAPPGCVCKPEFVLNEKTGKCVKPETCPVTDKGCGGDLNATHADCPSSCPPTCANRYSKEKVVCPAVCDPSGCVCKKGYIFTKKGGKCVKSEDCPVPGCKGDSNAVFSKCPSACEPNCTNPKPDICTLQCMPPGCVCKSDFVLNEKTGKCVKLESCPVVGCKGDRNATYTECTSYCPPSCDNIGQAPYACIAACAPAGCACNPGYVLNKDGKCINPKDCSVKGCGGDPNAVYKNCTSACEPSCLNPNPQVCTKQCLPPSCVCKPDFVLNEKTRKCVKLESCPVIGCGGDPNAVYKECTSACEPTCTNPDRQICTLQCKPGGCGCKKGYFKNEKTGKCVKPETCPVVGCKGDRNSTYSECTSYCPPTCDDIGQEPKSCIAACAPAGCACNPGYVLNKDGKCINPKDCPVPGCKGDSNAVFSKCPSACEPNCTNPKPEICTLQCMPPGCVCKSGHVLNEKTGKCVKPETCPEKACEGDPNAMYSECPSACQPTCTKSDPNQPCTYQCLAPGCVCKPGFVRNEKTRKCVNPETCPAEPQCKGDRNATYTENPEYCQPTCKNPDPEGECMDMLAPPACICKPGYIFKKKGGRCIRPEDCSGGSPKCKANETYIYCNAGCPTDYCPVDDSLAVIACDQPYPCPGGCACNAGYLIVSEDDDRCILSSECPQIKCSRPNEFWDADAPGCLREGCDNRAIPCEFQYPGPPRCRCIEGYYRDQNDTCVPERECPKPGCNGDLNAKYSECPSECPATCGDAPDQICTTACAKPGCVCNDGFVLSNPGGVCIRPEDCDSSSPVCGINEIATDCRRICPPQTCLSKYAIFLCIEKIPCERGCDCVPNYLRNDKGICIPSEECPPLKPEPTCGYNEVSVPCRQICPPQNCEIAYTDYACTNESKICEPGCDCLPDHLRNGSGICIPNDHCPYPSTPVCGINEIARDCKQICPPQSCQSKYIEYNCIQDIPCEPGCDCVANYLRNDEGICIPSKKCPPLEPEPACGYNEVSVPCRQICPPQNCDIAYTDYACTNESEICEPGCDCLPDHLRNRSGICVPNDQCPGPCQTPDECQRTCASPNPLNCAYNPPKENRNGCDCKEGYILSEKGGDCIPIEDCPPEIACHGDPNAAPKRCPKPCPSTCDSPDETPCKRACYPLACECKPGHLLSNETGLCILPDKCPGGNPCGKNGRFVDCKTDCPDDYCPVDDSRALVFCDPPGQCLSGCICNLNNKRKSRKHPKCITSSNCPPVNCTRPNEEWSGCPSACLAENCEDVNNQPITCNTLVLNCQPRCVCKKNHFRNSSEICIPAKDCLPECEDANAVYKSCVSACEPTCTSPGPYQVCTEECRPARCVCKEGFVLNEKDGKCVKAEHCPVPECEDSNAVYKSCVSACEPTCASPGSYQVCTEECRPARCVCKEGFVLNEKDGKCVKAEHCPVPECEDVNAVYKSCVSACEPTCASPGPYQVCTEECRPARCVCKEGFVLNEKDGKCVKAEHCPAR